MRESTNRKARRIRRGLVSAAAAAGMIASGMALVGNAHADHDGHVEVPDEDGKQFVWPMSSWVSATDHYPDGSTHGGSADFSLQLDTPVYPARQGQVREVSQYTQMSGYRVQIEHEGENGEVYVTRYNHLVDEPEVDEGELVDIDTRLGLNGRTGSAFWAGPHIHFAISIEDDDGELQPIKIPNLEIGDWVESGEHIPGYYEGLDTVEEQHRPYDVEVADDFLHVYETTSRDPDEVVAELSAGDEVTVQETYSGQLRVEVDGELGWIAHSGTRPAGSEVYGLEIVWDSAANVRSSPDMDDDGNIIGVAASGARLTGYESQDGWHRVLWHCNADTNRSDDPDDVYRSLGGCPGLDSGSRQKYGWIGPNVSGETAEFETRTRIDNLAVHANHNVDGEDQPDYSGDPIGEMGESRDLVEVLDTRNGWYRIDFDGQDGWVRGWYTAGRH